MAFNKLSENSDMNIENFVNPPPGGTQDIELPEFIAIVAEQLKEANRRANQRIAKTNDDPFLFFRDVQLQIAFTATVSNERGVEVKLLPWVLSAGVGASKVTENAILHTVTINLATEVPDVKEQDNQQSPAGGRSPDSRLAYFGLQTDRKYR